MQSNYQHDFDSVPGMCLRSSIQFTIISVAQLILNIINDDLEGLLDHETTKNNDVIWETLYVKVRELMNIVLKNLKSFLNLK